MSYTPLCPIRNSSVVSKTADYTVLVSDGIVLVDATSGPVTITLYTATETKHTPFIAVKKIDASGNAVTIDGAGAETIDGATTISLTTQNEVARLITDGTNWRKI